MAKIKEIYNLSRTFEVLLEISKKEFNDFFNIGEDYVLLPKRATGFASKLVKKGKEESTQYILIPKELKNLLKNKKECEIIPITKNEFIVQLKQKW